MNAYDLAHLLKNKCPFIWDGIEVLNSFLFGLRYGSRIERAKNSLANYHSEFKVITLAECPTESVVEFFQNQPEEAFEFFHPHPFDSVSIKRIQRNHAFLTYAVMDGEKMVGYLLLRSYFNGKSFLGRMVDVSYRGRGIAKMLNRLSNDVASCLGLSVFQTISPKNIASLKSAEAENELKIIKTMPNGDLFIKNLPKKKL